VACATLVLRALGMSAEAAAEVAARPLPPLVFPQEEKVGGAARAQPVKTPPRRG
jgi:hypothetical protein